MSFLDKMREWFCDIVCHEDHATVKVLKGDSLWEIAKDITGHGTNWTQIADLNPGLDEKYTVHPGDELNVPLEWAKEPEAKP